MFQTEAEGVF